MPARSISCRAFHARGGDDKDLPAALLSAQVRILDRKHGVDSEIIRTLVNPEKRAVRGRIFAEWKCLNNIDTSPMPSPVRSSNSLNNKLMTALQKDFTDWVFRIIGGPCQALRSLRVLM
jgi:hypothetical protein